MTVLIFTFAIMIGSFLNVCIYRIPSKESIVFPGSKCGSCQTQLRPRDLIPVLSWVLAKGKCRYCGEKVSIQYPVIELATAILTVAAYKQLGLSSAFFWSCFLLWTGIVISAIDLKHKIIPDRLSLLTAIGGLLYWIILSYSSGKIELAPLLGALIGGGFLLLLALFSSMGGGDVKYMAGASLFLTPGLTVFSLYVAFISGGLISLFLMISGRAKKGKHIPFGPFLVFGIVTAYIYGNDFIRLYLNWIEF